MSKKNNNELDIFLNKAFKDLNLKKLIIILFWTFFKKAKRDKFLDLILSGKSSIEAYNKVKADGRKP